MSQTDQNSLLNELLSIPIKDTTDDDVVRYREIDKDLRESVIVELLAKSCFLSQDTIYEKPINDLFVMVFQRITESQVMHSENQRLIADDEELKQLQDSLIKKYAKDD